MKIEVGKTYIDGSGRHVLIVSDKSILIINHEIQPFVGIYLNRERMAPTTFTSDGYYSSSGLLGFNLIKEYKPPATHRRDIIWYRCPVGLTISEREVGGLLWSGGNKDDFDKKYPEVHRQTVEYTE